MSDPVTDGGLVAPAPVKYSTITEPAAAGLEGLLMELSWLSAAACPPPEELTVNRPGEALRFQRKVCTFSKPFRRNLMGSRGPTSLGMTKAA